MVLARAVTPPGPSYSAHRDDGPPATDDARYFLCGLGWLASVL